MARISLFVVLVLAVAVSAERPRFRKQRESSKFLSRQEDATNATTERAEIKAPYPAAGFRPGRAFNLPSEDEEAKAAEAPAQSYGPPANQYGPPEDSTTTGSPNELENEVSPKSEAEDLSGNGVANEDQVNEVQPNEAVPEFYYVQLPSGEIQKVQLLGAAGNKQALKLGPVVEQQPILLNDGAPQSFYVSQYTSW